MRKLMIATVCLVPFLSGCLAFAGAAGAAGVFGYVSYEKNEAEQDFQASFDKTWKATLDALRGLKYAVPKEPEHAADSGELVLDDMHVFVARHPGNMTRVSVRIGTFDTAEHRRRAGLILEKIDDEL